MSEEITEHGGIIIYKKRHLNYDIRLIFDIIHLVFKYNVNIINTHFARSDIFGTIAGIITKTKVIKSVHGIPWNNSKIALLLDKILMPYRSLTICNSIASQENEYLRNSCTKSKVIYNAVTPRKKRFKCYDKIKLKKYYDIPYDSFVILHVGGFTTWRHQDTIVDALEILVKKHNNIYCIFIGEGTEKKRIMLTAKEKKIETNIKFIGHTEKIDEFHHISDLYVNMASEEGFGIAVVEAMLSGLPVILANAGAHPELIINNESGFLIEPKNAKQLHDCILYLYSNTKILSIIGNNSKNRAKKLFNEKKFIEDFEQTYIKICK
jgi:glycosyltransferase involved in cell wall biosynthesis